MPRLSASCAILSGVADLPATLDLQPLPVVQLDGRTATMVGSSEFLTDSDIVGQVKLVGGPALPDPNEPYDTAILAGADMRQAVTGEPNGCFTMRAGSGRFATIRARGGFYDSARPGLNQPGRFPLAVSDEDGTLADCDHQSGGDGGIAITGAFGQPIFTIPEHTRSNGEKHRAYIREGIFTHASPEGVAGWSVWSIGLQASMPFAPIAGVQWMVPVYLAGMLYFLERFETFLSLRRHTETTGKKVVEDFPLFNPDARVDPSDGSLFITWARDQAETVGSIRTHVYSMAELAKLPDVRLPSGEPVVPNPPDPGYNPKEDLVRIQADLAAVIRKL